MDDLRRALDDTARRLRPHYTHFLSGREHECWLTGHSHQAWPDVSREGQIACWSDAARLIDDKWSHVFGEILPEFQRRVASRLGTKRAPDLAVAPNTHELVYRLASCFPTDATVVTTNAEFHSLRRQLHRLSEEGLKLTEVPVETDPDTFVERFITTVDDQKPDWVALSQVLFTTARHLTGLPDILSAMANRNIPVLIDVYHAFNVMPLTVDTWPGTVFVTGGGYKYAQTGEGACWMLLPANAESFRPRQTGWFSAFDHLESMEKQVHYGQGGFRFFGATFDPTGLYRGVWTLRWMDQMGLIPERLAEHYRMGTRLLNEEYDRLDLASRGIRLASPRDDPARGGFVVFDSTRTESLHQTLRAQGVHTDYRGSLLRMGPAPYTTGAEITRAMELLHAACA